MSDETPARGAICDLDLTAGGVLAPDLLQQLDRLAAAEIAPFDAFIATLGAGLERDIDWWVSRPASRNNFVSQLFNRCVQLHLVQNLLAEMRPMRVRVDDEAFAAVLAQLPGVTVTLARSSRRSRLRLALHDIASSMFHTAAAAAAAWSSRSRRQKEMNPDLIALDVFVLRDSVRTGKFQDRYFPGLIEALPGPLRSRIRYVPQFYRIRNYRTLFRQLRANLVPFLLPQDWLRLTDYGFAFGHWWRLRKFWKLRATYRGVDFTALLQADLAAGRFAQSAIAALLTYRFWRNPGLPVQQILDWYEGQDIDHALAAAINWHGSQIRLTGFRPACSRMEMAVMPAAHEVAAGVVPPLMAVTGDGFHREIAKALPDLRTQTAPGLRYTHLAALPRPAPEQERCILVTLPLAAETIAPLRELIGDAPRRSAKLWLIKPHPATPPGIAEKLFSDRTMFELVRGNFYDWLPRSALVLGLESSALLEAVAYGVPAICLARGNIPTKSPFPNWLDRKWWRICYSQQDLEESLAALSAVDSTPDERNVLRHDLLSPADDDNMRNFLTEMSVPGNAG